MNRTLVQDNDTPYLIGEIAKSSESGQKLAWKFVKERWDEMFERYGSNIFLLGRMLTAVLNDFSSQDQLGDIEKFFKGKVVGTGKNAIDQSVQNIKFRIVYKQIIKRDLWFQEN